MRAAALLIALLACEKSPPPAPPVVQTTPVPVGVLAAVGAKPRAYAALDLHAPPIRERVDAYLNALPGDVLAKCALDPTHLDGVRVAVGEPLRVAAELDGAIDARAVACVLGGSAAVLAQIGITIHDREGGVSVEYAVDRDHAAAARAAASELMSRCTGNCAVARVGPATDSVWVEIGIAAALHARFSGPGVGAGAVAFASAFAAAAKSVPEFGAVDVRVEGGALVVTLAGTTADLTAFALAIRAQLLEAFKIPSSSMEPALHIGDHVYIVKGPLLGPLVPGDILVYSTAEGRDYVKRYVAGAGQIVSQTDAGIAIDGRALALEAAGDYTVHDEDPDGKPLERAGALFRETLGSRRYPIVRTGPPREAGSWTVPAGEVFFLGDNRDNSNDSRYAGTTPVDQIKGRVVVRWFASRDGAPHWDRIGTPVE